MNRTVLSFFAGGLLLSACSHSTKEPLFTPLGGEETGIHFRNDIRENDSSAAFIDEFAYMGGGVGIGDFNNDGLKDVFFTGNQTSCRLYINKGGHRFEDITAAAGLTTDVWATGVSIVDINQDGYDDIYVCVFGKDLTHPARNLLFINQHNLTFKEEAAAYGLAFSGYSTQAVFFDYDRDGRLDMYLTNYRLNGPNANTLYPRDRSGFSPANDRLFRNDGGTPPRFTDVTMAAGIKEDGYGLGVIASDLNNDGWPDIYVANDFVSNDELWLNNHDGTFTNVIAQALGHQSYSSMGVDAADIDNNGWPDIITLDMLPEYNRRRKLASSFMTYDRYQEERSLGYEPEFMRNMLQLNNGLWPGARSSPGPPVPFFSEIGRYAGISATDWSWSVLIADFDNDGRKDVHITNGIGRDFINADFLEFSSQVLAATSSPAEQHRLIRDKLASLRHVVLRPYLYLNNGDYTFTDASATSGMDEPSMSNGAAWVDLDNDGDLDLVVNNIDREASVFINNTVRPGKPLSRHYLEIRLQGDSGNRQGFGARVRVYDHGRMQLQEESPVRGYFSSVDRQMLFGLGPAVSVDSVVVAWPDGVRQAIGPLKGDTVVTVRRADAGAAGPDAAARRDPPEDARRVAPDPAAGPDAAARVFTDVTAATHALYRHVDVPFNDFAAQPLLPQKYSQLGPFIATGDMNGDGLTDFFVGGAFNFSGRLFFQRPDGTFSSRNLSDSIKMQEDMDCALFDADGDGDLDLLVTCGDTRYPDTSEYYVPRLYRNDGKGNFTLWPEAIPAGVRTIAGCLSVGDYNGDGQPDVFIGGRVSGRFPLSPRGYLLRNDKGRFTDVTAAVCPALQWPGMVTAALWADLDRDGRMDLVVAGDWMPVRFFSNRQGRLVERTDSTGLGPMNGMWRSLAIADVDGDGDLDIVAGNLGRNCDYRASPSTPVELYAKDLDGNGIVDPILTYYLKDDDGVRRPFPAISRAQFARQVPAIKRRFLYHRDYAGAGLDQLFSGWPAGKEQRLTCVETGTCWLENRGNGKWVRHALPAAAQFAPVNTIICEDLDGDGLTDLLLAGNDYQTEVLTGRYDASYGCWLKGVGRGAFIAVPPAASGFAVKGDVKNMKLLAGTKLILVAVNNDSLRVFATRPSAALRSAYSPGRRPAIPRR